MSALSLRISLEGGRVTKTIQFDPNTTVFDACRIIKDKFADAVQGTAQEFGLFLADDDTRQGVWLEPARNLGYYMLHNLDVLEYRQKHRTLRVRMLDGALKTILVDDSLPVSQLMVVICTKIGITNHEEYGLVREDPEAQNENQPDNRSNTGTLTLRRKAQEKERDTKMESLRKKLRTDDEINWVDVGKTLREQGIDEQETVLLRRKFFYSDQNIDSRDPVQLNLLYVQARDAILDGTHPVTQDKACEFAGIQVQIQFGDHNEAKHKPGFLDLREFLPSSYVRTKNIERKIFAEHRKLIGLSDLDAKYRYTKTARELPTYGVTFFLVKEKMMGKNKLVPRLLGVTKDSVLRLDELTKEILKSWPLTTVRRWGASPNTFTLDFGDYADSYYSVQTTEAEQIVQLIAGYIDIILKKKQAKDHFGIEGDEGSTMVEESVAPSKATFLQHEETNKSGRVETHSIAKPAVMRGSDDLQQTRISSVMSEPQRALLGYISAGQDALNQAEKDLETKVQLPPLGTDPGSLQWREETLDTSKQTVTTHLATMNAATAQVVTASQPDEIDHEAVGAAVSQITQSIPEVTKEVRLIAALMDDDCTGDKLLEATRKLCNAFSDLLKSAEPESKEPRQNLLNAATRVGEASGQVLSTIGEESIESRELHDMLLSLAKAVANTTAALVLKAKSIAAVTEDEATRNRVIGAASQCALATSQLVACARVVAPTIHSPACREQLEAAAREVAKAVANLAEVCNEATDNQQLRGDLTAAAKDVSKSLADLLEHIKLSTREKARRVENENPVDNVLVATDILVSSTDPQEMIRQAQQLGRATALLIQSIKGEAEGQNDQSMQRKLLEAAKQLADATARMVEAARLCAGNPHDSGHQESLRAAAEELRVITTTTANTPAMKRQLIGRLEQCAKQAASAATQCITAAQNSLVHSTDVQTKELLLQDCQAVADQIPRLVTGVKGTLSRPDDPNAQLALIDAAEMFLEPGAQMAASARDLQPTVQDQAAAQQLGRGSVNLTHAIQDMRLAAHRAREACGGNELDAALEAVRNLRSVLNDTRIAAQEGTLRPLPGETAESSFKQLSAASAAADAAMWQLATAAQQGNRTYAGVAGRDTALALGEYTKSVRGVLVTTKNPAVVDYADDVIVDALRVIEEAQRSLQNLDNQEALLIAVKRTKQSLGRMNDCMPGVRDINEAFETITDLRGILDTGEYPPSDRPYGELQSELKSAAEQLNNAGGQVAHSYESPIKLANTSQEFCQAYKDLLTVTLEMAGQTGEERAREEIVSSLRGVSNQSISLMAAAKNVAGDLRRPNARNELASAARLVTESINRLVDVCTQAAPGQKECDGAIRCIESLRPLLESAQESLTDQGYFECLETVMEKSRTLGDGMTGIANNAKNSKHVEFGHSVISVSESIRGLIESAAQAAYLVGVSNPTSVGGRPGIVDQSQYARASQAIRQSCDVLRSPSSSQQEVLAAATIIAKHTSSLCNACRSASSTTTNPVAKRHFVQAAKEVANSTASLVREIKALDKDYSAASRQRCAEATEPLLEAVSSLCQFACSPEFISIPARISTEGRKAQEPILSAGGGILDGAVEMVRTAKVLALTPTDPPVWQQLAIHSRNVSESIKRLASSIREKAPGQMQCDQVLEVLKDCSRELNAASLAVGVDGLPQRKDNNLQGFTNQSLNAASELIDRLEPVKSSAKKNAESLGHAVNQIAKHIVPLTGGVIGACSQLVHSGQQTVLINQVKSVVECCSQLVQTAKSAGGNPRAAQLHPELDEAVESTREAIQELNATVERLSTENGVVTGLMEQVSRSMSRISDKRQSFLGASLNDTYVDYQTRMVQSAKEIARYANEINAKAAIDPSKLAQLCVEMTHHYTQLAQDAIGASALTTSPDVAIRIRNTVQDLGRSVNTLIQSTTGIRKDDSSGLVEISRGARDVSEKVAQVLAALQAGSRGTQACINASSTVSAIISDLDTTIMFATAGTLHAANDEEGRFSDHREHILKTAKALVEDTKILVAGAAGTQDQLAAAAQNAVTTILQLADAVKHGAASLGSGQPDSQVMVMNAVKDVAAALGELINATKLASGKPINDPAMNDLKDSAKVMVMNVTSLLKTVKAVEDEHTRGTRAMEATVDAISQELRSMQYAPEMMRSSMQQLSKPEDLITVTKHVTAATAKAVAAGTSNLQSDIAAAANLGRKTISDMLIVCKSVAWSCAETAELRQRTLDAGSAVAIAYRDLLEGILHHCTADERMQLSRRVAMCVTDLVGMAQLLKGSEWVDPEDPTVIAENELLGAAASIEAAAKKLANLRPRRQEVKETDENMNFDEMILEAAQSIMAASSSLVRAANAAQRELIDQGKVAKRPLTSSDDGQWSEGLISAARLVAAAAHSLVEAAQNLVQGVGTEEMLISSAKQVASSTAQLLIACKVKSDPNSETGRRLQAAGNAVIKSTDKLVQAAQQAIEGEEEHTLRLNRNMVDGMAQEINARSEILMRERQLEEAKNKLIAIRHLKYRQKLAGGFTTDESDEGGVAPPPFTGYSTTISSSTSPKPPHTLPKPAPGSYSPAGGPVGASTLPRLQQSSPGAGHTGSPTFQRPGSGNQLLTANAVPKPYQSDTIKSPSALVSPSMLNRTYDTTRVENTNLSASKFNRTQFDAAVQDLQNKVQPLSTFRGSPTQHTNGGGGSGGALVPQTYEGFTTRYETRVFQNANNTNPSSPNPLTTVEQKFAKLNLETHDNLQEQQRYQQHQQQQQQTKPKTPPRTFGTPQRNTPPASYAPINSTAAAAAATAGPTTPHQHQASSPQQHFLRNAATSSGAGQPASPVQIKNGTVSLFDSGATDAMNSSSSTTTTTTMASSRDAVQHQQQLQQQQQIIQTKKIQMMSTTTSSSSSSSTVMKSHTTGGGSGGPPPEWK
ncbi:talin-2-like isoform X2 [Anopheles albimanus]|uniref:talin-2-like isoform X2 n=1 Tax=Anopheles albimanus TaxID=7167 RepID=UPI0016417979|nr:talin-2-like isoform X2 [Anopheles albimanus]